MPLRVPVDPYAPAHAQWFEQAAQALARPWQALGAACLERALY